MCDKTYVVRVKISEFMTCSLVSLPFFLWFSFGLWPVSESEVLRLRLVHNNFTVGLRGEWQPFANTDSRFERCTEAPRDPTDLLPPGRSPMLEAKRGRGKKTRGKGGAGGQAPAKRQNWWLSQ